MKKKILIIGASGLIGNAIFNELNNYKIYDVYGTIQRSKKKKYFKKNSNKIFSKIKIENINKIISIIQYLRPHIVINCAAIVKKYIDLYTAQKIIEINSSFPKYLSLLSDKYKFKLIQISTDCVFDGLKGNYNENSIPNARDIYGVSKLLGETTSSNAITIRTSIIGPELEKSQGLFEWFIRQKGIIYGYSKFLFSGLTCYELAKIIRKYVLTKKINGIIHISSKPINKYSLLVKLQKIFNKNNIIIKKNSKIKINRILKSNFQKKYKINVSSWNQMLLEMKKKLDENFSK